MKQIYAAEVRDQFSLWTSFHNLLKEGLINDWALSFALCVCVSHVRLFVTPWTVAHHAPLSMGFSRQEHWSGLPRPPPGDLFDPGTESESLMSPALAGGFFFYHQRHLGSTILKQLNAYTHTPTHGLRLIHLYIYSNKKHMLYFKTITLPPQNRKSGFLTLQSQDIRIWGKSQIWWNAYKLTPSGNSYMWRCAFQLMEQSVKNKIGNLIWQKVALQFVTLKMFWKNWHYYGLPREFLR